MKDNKNPLDLNKLIFKELNLFNGSADCRFDFSTTDNKASVKCDIKKKNKK